MADRTLAARLAALAELKTAPAAEAHPALEAALRGSAPAIVARAAEIAAARKMTELLRALEAAFDRYLDAPPEKDKGGAAKVALAEACDALGSGDARLFLRGARCVHREPAFGGPTDRAAPVRARSVHALFRLRHPDAIHEAVRLLVDPEPAARAGAARALANGAPIQAVPVLRLKALMGDAPEHARVLEETFGSLLALDPEASVEFVAGFLLSEDEVAAETAALALGDARLEAACAPLVAWAATLPDARVRLAFTALAALRCAPAVDALLDEVRRAPPGRARIAADALAPLAIDPAVAARLRDATAGRPA